MNFQRAALFSKARTVDDAAGLEVPNGSACVVCVRRKPWQADSAPLPYCRAEKDRPNYDNCFGDRPETAVASVHVFDA